MNEIKEVDELRNNEKAKIHLRHLKPQKTRDNKLKCRSDEVFICSQVIQFNFKRKKNNLKKQTKK